MKLRKILLIATATLVATGAYAQRSNRVDICKEIPGLTIEQTQKIDRLSVTHQQKMDRLRSQFYAERNVEKATGYKTEMNTEMKNHFNNISAILTPEQQIWFDQNCYSDGQGGYYVGQGKGRGGNNGGQGLGRGYNRNNGKGSVRGSGRRFSN